MAELLSDRAPESFLKTILGKLPAPYGPDRVDEDGNFVPGEQLWESGMQLVGQQWEVAKCPARFVLDAGGIRSGKSLRGALRILFDYYWRTQVRKVKNDLWGVIAIDYEQAKETMRHLDQLFTDLGTPHDLRLPDNGRAHLTFPHNDCEIISITAADVTKIAGRPYRGMVITEANQSPAEAWLAARRRVTQTRGWVYMEGTFESQEKGPWYAQLWEDWQKEGAMGVSFSVPSWENTIVFPGGREDTEIVAEEKSLPPLQFMEKYGGKPTKRSDLVMLYADERHHVAQLYPALGTSFDPERPVYLFSDPGTAHAYAVFAVQFWRGEMPPDMPGEYFVPARKHGAGNVCWVIDTVYRWGRSVKEIVDECASRPWAVNAEVAVMDVAAKQRRTEGDPVVEQWAKHWMQATGQRIYVYTQPVPLHPGYDIHKRALLNSWPEDEAQRIWNSDGKLTVVTDPLGPRLMFDPQAATPLFGGMVDGQRYQGEYNLHRNRRAPDGSIMSDDPLDRDNDGIKALNYGLYWYFGPAGQNQEWAGMNTVPWEGVLA